MPYKMTHSEQGLSKMEEIPMQVVPAGTITLRDDRKKSSWSQQVTKMLVSQFPVTQLLYSQVTGTNPARFNSSMAPVESVSWFDAIDFCNELSTLQGLDPCYQINSEDESVHWDQDANGYRLLTDAEWEYACRAGVSDVRYGELDSIAWFQDNSDDHTHTVGQKLPNKFGLNDMLGNVWEWCWDVYDPKVYGSYRVFRGGGWADEDRGVLASNRRRSHPTYAIDDLGFRIARSVE
jgi:formylglycine-generating enzyme required for sulfatase activity